MALDVNNHEELINYAFDPELSNVFRKYQALIRKGEVEKFLANKLLDDIEMYQKNNQQCLFDVCKLFGINEVFVGDRELVTNGAPRCDSSPSIWRVKAVLDGEASGRTSGFGAGCSNGEQTQTNSNEIWFGEYFVNKAYDVNTGECIDVSPFHDNMVCSRHMRGWW